MLNDYDSQIDYLSSPSYNNVYSIDNADFFNDQYTSSLACDSADVSATSNFVHDFIVQFRELLSLNDFNAARHALESIMPGFTVAFVSYSFFLFLLELVYTIQQNGKEAGMAYYHTFYLTFSDFLKANPKKSTYLETILENTRIVHTVGFKARLECQKERLFTKLANSLYSMRLNSNNEDDCASEDSLDTVDFSDAEDSVVLVEERSPSNWQIVNEERESLARRQENEEVKEIFKKTREYKRVKFNKVKKENVDKIMVRKFKNFLKNEYKQNKQLFAGHEKQFWISFVNLNLIPPFQIVERQGTVKVFRSFNYDFLNWLFCREGAVELWAMFCDKRGDLEIRNIVGKYRIDEKEEASIKQYVYELAKAINETEGDVNGLEGRGNMEDSFSSSEEN